MSNYLIRPAQKADIDDLILLCAAHAEYEKAEYSPIGKAEKLSQHLFNDRPSAYCLVAEIEGNIVGYATYSLEFSTWDADHYAHMDCLYLQAEFRSKGIGEALVQQIAAETRAKGYDLIQWQTPVFNHRAIQFYHRIGAKAKEKVRFYLSL